MQKQPRFVLSKPQQGAVFVLLICLISVQFFRYFSSVEGEQILSLVATLLNEQKLDSLQLLVEVKTGINFTFNPNFISDYKAYTLGLSVSELTRLKDYLIKGKWINSAQEFQRVSRISDSLLEVLKPQFKFPEFIQKSSFKTPSKSLIKKDINTADVKALQAISGIGPALSERIVKYRTYLSGFSEMDQCYEVYGLDSLVVQKLIKQFDIQTPPKIVKLNINTASLDELQKTPYLSRQEARAIIAYRTKNTLVTTAILSELFDEFPNKKARIKLYLY